MKYKKTRYPGIYKYSTKSGDKYRVRIGATDFHEEYSKQGFKTINEALAHLKDIQDKLDDGCQATSKRTLAEHWKEYSAFKIKNDSWKRSTQENMHHRMQPWINKFGDMPLKSITRSDVQVYIHDLYEEKDYSQETMESYFRSFFQVVQDAVDEGYLQRNPFKKVSYKKRGGWKPKEKVIPLESYQEFMKLASKHMRKDVFRCLYLVTFGLRRSEAYAITQKDIAYLDNGLATIHINKARTAIYTEGTTVKSSESNRHIVVDETASKMLKEQTRFARNIKANFNQTLHRDDYIFISPETANPYPIKTLNKHIHKTTQLMEKPVRITPHMLRHMFATYASASGVDPLQLRKFLGHSHIDMTSHYTKSSIEGGKNVIKQMRKYLEF